MVAGDPEELRSFTDGMATVVAELQTAADDASSAVTAYNDAPRDLPDSELDDVGADHAVDAQHWTELIAVPAAFATLVEVADGDPAMLGRLDQLLLDTWLAADDFEDADALLGELTGTPAEMADDLRALLASTGELSDDEIEDLIERWEEHAGMAAFAVGETYDGVEITEENRAGVIWSAVVDGEAWDDALPGDVVEDVLDVSARLAVVADDPGYTAALFEDLGGEDTAGLARMVAVAAWSDTYTSGGEPFDAVEAIAPISTALGTASRSGSLPDAYWDDLFDQATTTETVEHPNLGFWGDDEVEVLDDAWPALFSAGTFAPEVATRIGQGGINVLHGQTAGGTLLQVDRGIGSPFHDGFGRMSTSWEDRGTVLLEAATRTPEAATELLLDDRNVAVLTDEHFDRADGEAATEHSPSWDVVGDEVGAFIEAGTIENLGDDPDGTRQAAANVINEATGVHPNAAHEALADTYAEMGAQYMAEFAVDDRFDDPATVGEDGLSVGSLPATRFLALGMDTEAGRELLTATHEVVALDIAVNGIESEYAGTGTDWEQQLGKLDAIMLGAELGEDFETAEAAQEAALEYNSRLQTGQTAITGVVGLAPHTNVALIGARPVADEIREQFLEQPTNQIDIAESEANVTTTDALTVERRLIGTAHLVSALRAEAAGALTPEQRSVLDFAADKMPGGSLDRLRDVAAGGDAAAVIDHEALADDIDALREAFAGHEQLPVDPDLTHVSDYRWDHLTRFPEGLYAED